MIKNVKKEIIEKCELLLIIILVFISCQTNNNAINEPKPESEQIKSSIDEYNYKLQKANSYYDEDKYQEAFNIYQDISNSEYNDGYFFYKYAYSMKELNLENLNDKMIDSFIRAHIYFEKNNPEDKYFYYTIKYLVKEEIIQKAEKYYNLEDYQKSFSYFDYYYNHYNDLSGIQLYRLCYSKKNISNNVIDKNLYDLYLQALDKLIVESPNHIYVSYSKKNINQYEQSQVKYKIASGYRDFSYSNITRISTAMSVTEGLEKDILDEILTKVANDLFIYYKPDALVLKVFTFADDISFSSYTVADVIVAPYGKWENAGQNGPIRVSISYVESYFEQKVTLGFNRYPKNTRKKIYNEIYQAELDSDNRAQEKYPNDLDHFIKYSDALLFQYFTEIKRKYSLTDEELNEIRYEF